MEARTRSGGSFLSVPVLFLRQAAPFLACQLIRPLRPPTAREQCPRSGRFSHPHPAPSVQVRRPCPVCFSRCEQVGTHPPRRALLGHTFIHRRWVCVAGHPKAEAHPQRAMPWGGATIPGGNCRAHAPLPCLTEAHTPPPAPVGVSAPAPSRPPVQDGPCSGGGRQRQCLLGVEAQAYLPAPHTQGCACPSPRRPRTSPTSGQSHCVPFTTPASAGTHTTGASSPMEMPPSPLPVA